MSLLVLVVVIIGWSVLRQSEVEVVESSKKLPITVSMPLLRDLTEEIGRDQVVVTSIINGPSCNHHYEPASGDLINISRSTVFIKVGMGFDLWADKLIESVGENMTVIDASQGVTGIDTDHHGHEHGDHEEHSDHGHHYGNPHYWGNPENVKLMAENILKGLIKALPEKEDYFTRNYQEYLSKIDQTVSRLRTELARVSDKKILSYSAAFPYFYHYFGFDNLATVEDTCEQEVSPRRIAEVIRIIKANQVKVVVGEAVYPKLPENLVRETGTKLVLLWPNTNETGDYLDTLSENVKKLVAALNEQ